MTSSWSPRCKSSSALGRSMHGRRSEPGWHPTVDLLDRRAEKHPRGPHPVLRRIPGRGRQAPAVPAIGASGSRSTKHASPPTGVQGRRPAPSPAATDRCEDRGCAVPTTTRRPATDIADFIGGFVAAEGCFHARRTEGWFGFTVALGAADQRPSNCSTSYFGCGRTTWCRRDEAALRRRGHASSFVGSATSSRCGALHGRAPAGVLQARAVRTAGERSSSSTGSTVRGGAGPCTAGVRTPAAGEGALPAPLLRGLSVGERWTRGRVGCGYLVAVTGRTTVRRARRGAAQPRRGLGHRDR